MEYTWKELEKNIPLVINYNDDKLRLWTFQALVPKTAKFIDLGPIAVEKVEEMKAAEDPSYTPNPSPPVPVLHYFAIDYRQTVRELAAGSSILDLKDYLSNGTFTVNLMETTEDEQRLAEGKYATERIVWIRRYYPLGGVYWRPAGLPFTFVAKEGEKFSDFRVRLQSRLHFDDEAMKRIDIAVLTQHEHKVVSNDEGKKEQTDTHTGTHANKQTNTQASVE
jgi:hypothetical protein